MTAARVRCCAALLLAAIGVAGCALGPDYQRPALDLPAQHRGALDTPDAKSIATRGWWELFGDPELLALIDAALAANLDLRTAAARVAEARAQVDAARAQALPTLGAQLQASRSNQNATFANVSSFVGALSLNWELDLWGRYARATDAARAALVASDEARNGVVASLVAGVAQQYLLLQSLRRQVGIAERTAESQRESLRLVTRLAEQGVQSSAEVAQARSELLTTENAVPALKRQIAQAEHSLALLLGRTPQALRTAEPTSPVVALPPAVPAGLPSELLERRPDIRQAEAQLRAANANVGVARAQFFPTLSLTGLLGRTSPVLGRLLGSEAMTLRSIEGAALAPLYSGGALEANEQAALARREQAAQQYRSTVLVALQEVADALAFYELYGVELEGNRRRVAVANEVLRLARLRFRSGVIDFLDVLDAQRQAFAAELDLAASELNRQIAAVTLYRALGGGWAVRGGVRLPE